jgi:hypothetical protein
MLLLTPSILKNYFIFILLCILYCFKFAYTPYSFFYILSFLLGCYPFFVLYFNLKNNTLKWYDPLLIGYLVLFQIFFLSFFHIIKEPSSLDSLSYGGGVFDQVGIAEKFNYIFKAQTILSVFSLVLLSTNKKKIIWNNNLKKYIPKGDVFFSKIIFAIVLISLFNLFKNFKFLMLNLGTNEVEAQSGEGLISILARGGLFFIPFAILNLRRKIKLSNYFIIVVLISLLEIPGGSRSAVLYFVIFSLFYYGMVNDFTLKKKDLIFPSSLLLSILIIMSIIRGYNSSSLSIDNNLTSFESIGSIWEDDDNSSIFVAGDRVRPIAMMLKYVEGLNYSYTYGETLVARPLKTFNIINRKIGFPEIRAYTADEYTHLWRFGSIVNKKGNWAVPLSLPGEFYLQFGYISLVLFSFFFGKLIFLARHNLKFIRSNFRLAFCFMLILLLMKTVESELMYNSVLFILVLPTFSLLHSLTKFKF